MKYWKVLSLIFLLCLYTINSYASNIFKDDDHLSEFVKNAEEIKKRASQGDATAQRFLGMMYIKGAGVPKDLEKAFSWYEQSARQGDMEAQDYLGLSYYQGWGVKQNYALAKLWFEKSAIQGHAPAQARLGTMYEAGIGVPQNYKKAICWFERAAYQENTQAQTLLGLMYQEGKGVPKNFVKAHKWLNLASAKGEAVASQARDSVAMKMQDSEIEQAQKLAEEWGTKHILEISFLKKGNC